jgi:hypothetical protein
MNNQLPEETMVLVTVLVRVPSKAEASVAGKESGSVEESAAETARGWARA